jgi:hypothetical protein
MPATYEPIATTTLGSAAQEITFSSIASTWKDIKIVVIGKTTSSGKLVYLRFNGDTGANYSGLYLNGDGSAAFSGARTSTTQMSLSEQGTPTPPNPVLITANVFSYAGSTFKTVLGEETSDNNGNGAVGRNVGLWRSTAAITSITIRTSSSGFDTGTTATLYGIKNA